MVLENQTQSQDKLKTTTTMEQPEQIIVANLPSRFKKVCVFCGSSPGKRPIYKEAAVELGKELVARRLDLVYGGGSIGLMGSVSETVLEGGRKVIGVIPRALMGKEITGKAVGKVIEVGDMHERKAKMASLSDCFIALPGGYGTLEELLEVTAWVQLRIHDKPVGLLNVGGYYDPLLAFLDQGVDDGFIKPSERPILISATSAKELLQKLEEYELVPNKVLTKEMWESELPKSAPEAVGLNTTTTPELEAEVALDQKIDNIRD